MADPALDARDWLSRQLAPWLAFCASHGHAVGLREHRLCRALVLRLQAHGQWPASEAERLACLAPLLCRDPVQQVGYAALIEQFLQARAQSGRVPGAPVPVAGNRTRWLVALCVGLVCLLAVGLGWLHTRQSVPAVEPPAPVASQPAPSASGGLEVDPPRHDPVSVDGPPIYVPQRPFASQSPANRSWVQPLRDASLLLAALSAVFTAWYLWRRRQRRSYAEHRSVAEQRIAQRHMLRARHAQALALPSSLLVPTARLLRQRNSGLQQQVDARATIAASVRQGGFLAWRYAARSVTPEYLVLIDDAGADDQQARFHEAMVDALGRRGVAMDVFHFRQSPSMGCWRWSKSNEAEPGEARQPRDRTSFAALVSRCPKHRLLVFGGTAAAVRSHDGQPSDWTQHARQLGLRAWFTPLPVRSWGEVERWVTSAQGLDFLLLPMEPAALQTWAGWLASGRASLRQDARSPLAFPALLQLQPHAWGQRGAAPPAAVQAQLIDELGRYLGPRYTAWLAACAVFPALAWPLTLSLGRLVLGHRASEEHGTGMVADEADLAIGAGALAALPWFREGRLPDWLRKQLLRQLPADLHELLRQHLLKQLGDTPVQQGTDIAPLARLRRMLGGGRGPLADVLLLRFLEPALAPALAARLPEWVRRLLFSQGSALMGLRPTVAWLAALPMLGAVAAWPTYWDRLVPAQAWMASPAQMDAAMPTPLSGVAWAPDGSLLATAAVDGKLSLHLAAQNLTETVAPGFRMTGLSGSTWSPMVVALTERGQAIQWAHLHGRWDQRSLFDQGIRAAAVDPLGNFVALGTEQGDVQLVDLSGSSRRLIAAPVPPAPVLAVAVHAQGERVAAVDAQGRLTLAVASGNVASPSALQTASAPQSAALAFSPDRNTLAVAGGDGRVQLRSAGSLALAGELAPPPGAPRAALTGLAYSADGGRLAASNAQGQVLVWNVASGELIALVAAPGAAPARNLAFTADGSGLTGLNAEGRAWRWGEAMPAARLALLGCFTADQRGDSAVPAAGEARTLANRWSAATADGERVQPVAISPALFDLWKYGFGLPKPGTVQVALNQQGTTLQARLQQLDPIAGAGWVLDQASSATVPAANACNTGLPVQCPDPIDWPQEAANAERQQALREALAGMWSSKLASRAPATDRVMAGGDLVSDLVPLAANLALELARGPQPSEPNAQSRITQALRLALQASPVSVQRHSAGLCALASAAQPLSEGAAKLSGQLLARLRAAKGRQPRLQITVTDPARLREAQTLQGRLRSTLSSQGGIDVQVAQRAAAPAEVGSGVTTWGRSQQAFARWLARQAAVPSADKKADTVPLPVRQQALPAVEDAGGVDRYELVLAPATESAKSDAVLPPSQARLTTEAELVGSSVPAAIEAFWASRGESRPLRGEGGLRLEARRFLQPDRGAERGAIVLVSGRTESQLKYKEVVYDLYRNGYSVYIHDHRGQGLSDREPAVRDQPDIGHVERFDDFVADLDTWLTIEVLPAGHARTFLWAHSVGGAIAARYLESGRPSVARVQAAVLSSPMLGFAGLVPGLSAEIFSCSLLAHAAVQSGGGASRHLGGKGYTPAPLQDNIYTHSMVRTQRMNDVAATAPQTRLGAPSWGWIARSCDAARAARDEAPQVRTPLLLMVAGDDQIVLNDGAATFCQRLAASRPGASCGGLNGGPVVIAGAKHELLFERDALRSQAMGRALGFLMQQGR